MPEFLDYSEHSWLVPLLEVKGIAEHLTTVLKLDRTVAERYMDSVCLLLKFNITAITIRKYLLL